MTLKIAFQNNFKHSLFIIPFPGKFSLQYNSYYYHMIIPAHFYQNLNGPLQREY